MGVVVVPIRDPAAVNIFSHIRTMVNLEDTGKTYRNRKVLRYGEWEFIFLDVDQLEAQFLEREYPSDLYLFLSRHSSEKGIPALTVHSTGNFGPAEMGGIDRYLSFAPAPLMRSLLEFMDPVYPKTYEVTHHGPTLDASVVFVEIGSSEEEWGNEKAGKSLASAVVRVLEGEEVRCRPFLGIGGPHYAPTFTRIAMKTDLCPGHMIPKYSLPYLDYSMLLTAFERTKPRPELVVVDWKGLGPYKGEVQEYLERLWEERGVEWVKSKDL